MAAMRAMPGGDDEWVIVSSILTQTYHVASQLSQFNYIAIPGYQLHTLWRHVTQKRYVMRHGDYGTSDRYFDKEHFETNQKSLRLPVQKLWLK